MVFSDNKSDFSFLKYDEKSRIKLSASAKNYHEKSEQPLKASIE